MLAWVYERLFRAIEVDDSWARSVRDAQARGTVVYVLRNLSVVDFFALDYLTKRYHLPEIRFTNDLGLSMFDPMGGGWLQALRSRAAGNAPDAFARAIQGGASAALFLKRPPHLLEARPRGRIEGDILMRTLFEVQRQTDRRVLLMPQVFVWSRRAGTRKAGLVDALFGPSEWPGNVRSLAQFLSHGRHATMRTGAPVDLQEFLSRESEGADDDALVRRLTYTILRRLERERRAIVGPTRKTADRLHTQVIRSPKLQQVIADMAGEGAHERAVIAARARKMLRDMTATLDVDAVSALERVFSQAVSRMFSAVEVDEEGIERVREYSKEGTVVLLPSHKSHMDGLALAWTLYRHKLPLPLIAAGDNLNFFPVGPLLRRAGAFFIRRSFAGDRLYAAVVDAYVRRLIIDGWPIEFFPEGGRSRTGKLLPPKLGLLSIVVDAALAVPTRTTWFCPVSISYERFVEEKAFLRELAGADKPKEDVRGLVRSVEAMVGRYGRLSIQFGRAISLDQALHDPESESGDAPSTSHVRRRALIARLGYQVMNEINAATAVAPGSLVAMALLAHNQRGLPHADLLATCERLARTLRRCGARFSPSLLAAPPPAHDDASARPRMRSAPLREAVELFVRAGHVEARRVGDDVIYVVPPAARMSLDLAKNVIIHFFVERALFATALLASPGPTLPISIVRDRVLALSRIFKYEFTFRTDAPFDRIFNEGVSAMTEDGELHVVDPGSGEGTPALTPQGEDGRAQLELYANVLENFVEGYRVAARGLAALLRGALTPRDLSKRAITTGERMYLAKEIGRREAVSRPMLENAYASFVDQGYLARRDGRMALTESYANVGAVATIEARFQQFSKRG
jgi:glycerol-3-phosphate O-acyltransferase